jgi:uncharacterized protein
MDQPHISNEDAEARRRREEARTWGMLCHLSVFSTFVVPFGNIFGPLTVWLMKRDSIPEVREQGKESVNFQISMLIYSLIIIAVYIAAVLGYAAQSFDEPPGNDALLATLGWLAAMLGILIFELVCVIIATVKASRGETFRYPLSIRFIS